MKRAILALCAAFLLFFCTESYADTTNLLANGGFLVLTSSNLPQDWYAAAYRNQAGYSRITATADVSHSGQYSALVENASANDARFTCTVKVKPETLYRLSGYVLVDKMEDTGNGANFGIEGIYSFSDCLFDTNGEWQYLEWYGETGENQTEVTIGVRVGGYSAETAGKAYFDDIVLEEVDALPQDVIASLWYTDSASVVSSANEKTEPEKSTFVFIVFAALFLVLFFISKPTLDSSRKSRFSLYIFAFVMLLAAVLRVFLSMLVEGYEVDINCFTAWSLRMANVGPVHFYAPDYFCDYPPGAMLLLWPVGMLLNAVGLSNRPLVLLIVKLLPVLCDLIGGLLLFQYAKKRIGYPASVAVSVLYLLNPAALVNGAAWGQMDSVLALFILLTAFAAMDRKWHIAIPCFVVSLLVKPQAVLFAPIGSVVFLYDLYKRRSERKAIIVQAARGLGIALAVAAVIITPFAIGQEKPFTWLFSLYGKTIGSYAYATLNTANLYYLAGSNWTSLSSEAPMLLCILPACLFAAGAVMLFHQKLRKYLCSDAQKAAAFAALFCAMAGTLLIMLFCTANYSWYGYAMIAFAYLFAILCFYFDKRIRSLPFYMALALCGVYVLGIKVHERYLFPALILLLIGYVNTRDRRVLWLFIGFSITTFINTAIVLDNSILFGAAQGHLNQDTMFLNVLLCLANLCLYGLSCWIGMDGLKESKAAAKKEALHKAESTTSSYGEMLFKPRDYRLHLTLRDYLVVSLTTLLYACLAFSNLGSTVAPQTAWVSTSSDESVVLQLEEPSTFSVLYYAGVSYHDFSIAVSDDGVTWSESYPCEMREGLCYRWNYALNATTENGKTNYPSGSPSTVLWLTGKYLRVDARSTGLNLWEVVARDKNGNTLPLMLVSHQNAVPEVLAESKPASNLIDEINTCVGEPGWYNGTYFDEIYHARTAYEHLHGQAPYETTHPPLGKLFMSAAIALFGMTPFGWRFAGTLIGVLMLPAIYLLAMQLTHKRSVAVISMLGLTFDLMHFTQTRIATIDSFPVFFILLTYLFMIRYMQMDSFTVSDQPKLWDKAYLKTLIPLGLCGLCMGLSIASKWIGIYSAVGLAILFFLTMYRHFRVWDTAWKAEDEALTGESGVRIQAARSYTLHRIVITCGFCVVFFILIPALIYCLCYIPYLSPTGPVTLKRILKAQEGMFNYHSTPGLGMDHPFQSPWWQWPFILKPIWFSRDMFEPEGYASTILCFGNPWVFYIGAFAMVGVLLCWLFKYIRFDGYKLTIRQGNGDLTYVMIGIAFLAQYLPWVLVPRSMYIYHYFASVPFIILATAVLINRLTEKHGNLHLAVCSLYVVGAVTFFVMFFPYASGYLTNVEWLNAMKWFSKLYY